MNGIDTHVLVYAFDFSELVNSRRRSGCWMISWQHRPPWFHGKSLVSF
jgi:hypothetical protein